MARYLVERIYSPGLDSPAVREAVIRRNSDVGVTWLHSYVSDDRQRSFCLYDAPSPEAIRLAAERNDLHVERITRVSILDPYVHYRPSMTSEARPDEAPDAGRTDSATTA